MSKYIGIAKEVGDPWYRVTFMLYNRMVKVTLYTKKYKRPKYYWYGKESFDYCVNEQGIFNNRWFFGIKIN